MKPHITLIAVLALAILAAGCTADITGDGLSGRDGKDRLQQVILTATLDDEGGQAGTKTALIDKKFHWSPNDSISLFYGPGEDGGSLFISTNTDYVKKTTFSGYIQVVTGTSEGSDATKFWGIFPYDPTSSCVDGGAAVMTTVKSSQETGYNSWGKSQNISIGRSLGLTMGFSNLCGGFIFCVTQPGIERVVLRRNDGTPIAGQVKVMMDSDEKPVITQMLGTETEISVTAPEGFTPINGNDTTWFYVVVPPTENEEQYTFTLYNGSGQYAEYEVPYTYKVKRNTFKRMRPPIDEGLEFQSDEPVQFANANFKSYCVGEFDNNGDGEVSQSEADLVTKIEVITDDITSLGGIENFPNLIELKATGSSVATKSAGGSGRLSALDVSANTNLETLDCRGNQLTTLDVSNNPALTVLECTDNPLETIQMVAGQEIIMTTFEIPEDTVIKYRGALRVAFPDANFQTYVFENFDADGDDFLSQSECEVVTRMTVYTETIASLKGIECFGELQSLNCYPNHKTTTVSSDGSIVFKDENGESVIGLLTALDLSHNTELVTLRCEVNQLESLDISKNTKLTELGCSGNQLRSLDIRNNSALTELDCDFNLLDDLDVSNNIALVYLSCNTNNLKSLDISNNNELTYLICYNNQLTTLDVSHNTKLEDLNCRDNKLTSLDVSNNTALTNLGCGNNRLSDIDVSHNTALTLLSCSSNRLTDIDISNNTALTDLSCTSNQLTDIDISHNTALTSFSCTNNQLTSLDVSHNTALKILYCGNTGLSRLDVSNNTELTLLSCVNNQLTNLDVSHNTALTILSCYNNQLTSLDVSNNLALNSLSCTRNPDLAALYLSQGQEIKTISKPDYTIIVYVSGEVSGNLNTEPVNVGTNHNW